MPVFRASIDFFSRNFSHGPGVAQFLITRYRDNVLSMLIGAPGARDCVQRKSPRSTSMSDAANRAGTGQLIGVRMQPDELAAIDSYRRDLPGVPSRPEAMRRLCVQALDPRADNSAAPSPRPLREIVRDFFDADPSRVRDLSSRPRRKHDARRSGRNQLFSRGRHELLDPATRGARRARSIPALRQGWRSGRAGIMCANAHNSRRQGDRRPGPIFDDFRERLETRTPALIGMGRSSGSARRFGRAAPSTTRRSLPREDPLGCVLK